MRAGLANLMRASTRCMFPIAALLVWLALLVVPQGTDVLRASLERLDKEASVSDLMFLWAASGLLGLSVWYAARWLIAVQLQALPLSGRADTWPRTWLPRLGGAVAPGLVAAVLLWPGKFPALSGMITGGVALAFVAQAAALLLLFWKRAALGGLMQGPGRQPDGQPGSLPSGAPLPPFTVRVLGWALMLTALLALVFLLFALTAPRVVGAAAAAAIALASINLFGSFVLTYLPLRNGLPPLAPWLVAYAVVIGVFNDNHGPRLVASSAAGVAAVSATASPPAQAAASSPDASSTAERLSPARAFENWRQGLPGGDFYIVAAEGGGLRAAYWTAAVLEQLSQQMPGSGGAVPAVPGFAQRVFALSGVSGGSVGVAMWAAALWPERCLDKIPVAANAVAPPAAAAAAPAMQATTAVPAMTAASAPTASRMLGTDFLSPAVASLFYDDLAQRFVPIAIPALDRSRGLEEGWERAAWRIPGRPLEKTIDGFYAAGCRRLPELLLNSTVAETGQRAILSRLDVSEFVDVRSLMDLTPVRQPLSGLMLQSARFPLISPAGSVRALPTDDGGVMAWLREHLWPDTRMRLVDGGYFDNSGLQTALELLDQLGNAPAAAGLRPVLIVIRNEVVANPMCGPPSPGGYCPALPSTPPDKEVAVWRWLHESTPPLRGLYNVRASHQKLLARRTVSAFEGWVIEVQPQPHQDGLKPPLGWALSADARTQMYGDARGAAQQLGPVMAPGMARAASAAVPAVPVAALDSTMPLGRGGRGTGAGTNSGTNANANANTGSYALSATKAKP